MKKALHIKATLDQPELLENLVEKLAGKRYDSGYADEKMPDGRKALETSSTETFISGNLDMGDTENTGINSEIRLAYITQFLFTCIKDSHSDYDLTWASSLS